MKLLTVEIESGADEYQVELCYFQADIIQTRKESGAKFFKLLPKEKYPNLRNFGLEITFMFGHTYYSCETAFSTLDAIKNRCSTAGTDDG